MYRDGKRGKTIVVYGVLADVEGMSIRETARVFGLHRETVSKMLRYSVPPGYRRIEPVRRPKLDVCAAVTNCATEAAGYSGRAGLTMYRIF